MGDEFKSGGGNQQTAKDQATIINNYFTAQKESAQPSFKPGTLFGVPNLPPNYLERDDDLKEVRAALLSKETRRQHVGVLGMGGLGKSVLAAALARDKDVRAAFPDGIFWLTFGQRPDEARLLELQAGILRHIPPGQQPESLDHGATLLSLALEDRRCLLIADDLWDSRHLRHFPLGGDGSRFLLTTRDAEVIRKIGAHRCQIGLLSDPQARKLLAECSGYDENALPDEAAVIVQECGHLPLAIAAVGSMVMDESADFWQIVLKRLQTARLDKIPANVTIDYDYDNLFKVFQVSVKALPQEVQAYYKTLLVFPEDAHIPQSVLQLYWKYNCLGDYEPLEVVSILVKRSLFTKVNDEFFTLHDLLRDYLVFQNGRDNAKLHKQLLEAYKAKYPGGWHTIPYAEPYYFYKYWSIHAEAAGEAAQASTIADTLIIHQPLLNYRTLLSCLKVVDYQLADVASHLLKTNQHPEVLAACLRVFGKDVKEDAWKLLKKSEHPSVIVACLNILGSEAKEHARQLLRESQHHLVIVACLNIIGSEAKEDARRLLRESQHPHVLTACLKNLGLEAKDDARRLAVERNEEVIINICLKMLGREARDIAIILLSTNNNASVLRYCFFILKDESKKYAHSLLRSKCSSNTIAACLKTLGSDAKEDARWFLKRRRESKIIITCLKILGDEAKEDAKRLLKESKNKQVLCFCLKLLIDEAREDARRLLKESQHPDVQIICIRILRDEAREDAKRFLKESNDYRVIIICLTMLGTEAKEDARRLLATEQNAYVISACRKILGEEAEEVARQILKRNNNEKVLVSCLYILGSKARNEARELLKSAKYEGLLVTCIRILGKEAKAEAIRLANTGKNELTRENCRNLLREWEENTSEG